MHFIGTLGIDIWLLIAQVVNFLLLLFLLTKLVYRPLLARMEADEAAIMAAKQAESALIEQERQLEIKQKRYETRTKNKAKAIVAEAEEIAKAIHEDARHAAEKEKAAVLSQIRQRLTEMRHE